MSLLRRVAVDLGNLYIKGVVRDQKTGKVIKKKISNKITTEVDIKNSKTRKLQRGGNTYYIGTGNLNNNILKHTRQHILDQILVMISELIDDEFAKVSVALGLPPAQLNNESFRRSFLNEIPIGEEIEFRVDDSYRKVVIESVKTYYEGYSAFYNLINVGEYDDNLLVIDVGGGTIDCCSYKYDIDDETHNPVRTHTVEKGAINLIEELRQYINKKIDGNVSFEDIDDCIRAERETFKYRNVEYKISDYINSIETTVDNIMNNIDNKYEGLDKYQIVFVGGAAKLFKIHASKKVANEFELNEDQRFYANAEGYLEQLEDEE